MSNFTKGLSKIAERLSLTGMSADEATVAVQVSIEKDKDGKAILKDGKPIVRRKVVAFEVSKDTYANVGSKSAAKKWFATVALSEAQKGNALAIVRIGDMEILAHNCERFFLAHGDEAAEMLGIVAPEYPVPACWLPEKKTRTIAAPNTTTALPPADTTTTTETAQA